MHLSKKAEYGLRSVVGIARGSVKRGGGSGTRGTVQSQDIAGDEGIPPRFLEQILLELKRAGILSSKRGVGGGYQIARAPEEITLGEIVRLFDGPFLPIPCAEDKATCECSAVGVCGLGRCFAELRDMVNGHLDSRTIADILQMEQAPDVLSFEI